MIPAFLRSRRTPRAEHWPTTRLAPWCGVPPAHGHGLRIECHELSAAFKAFKVAAANSNPPAWCKCRYRGTHQLEFWFATAHERSRVAMLVTLHGLGTVLADCLEASRR